MPRTPTDYSRTVIYKIVCNDLNVTDCYVGHTTNFIKRKAGHKSNCNNKISKLYNLKVYQTIRDNEGWNNWSMIEIEKYPCLDSNEARTRERYWYENLYSSMNGNIPNRSIQEWSYDNKEHLQSYKVQYAILHYDKAKESAKKYREKPEIKEKKRVYREQHKEKHKEYTCQKYQEQKEFLAEKVFCDCGSICSRSCLNEHKKTIKHKENLKLKSMEILYGFNETN